MEYQSGTNMVVREKKGVVIEKELTRLYKQHKRLTPQLIVDISKDAQSKLHKFFEWNDGAAAEKYRLAQATQILMASKFMVLLHKQATDALPQAVMARPVRKFLPQLGRGSDFKMRNEVLDAAESRVAFIARKVSVLKSWCAGVIDVTELDEIREAIENAVGNFASTP